MELACVYAALALADEGHDITADKLLSMTEAAGVEVTPVRIFFRYFLI